MNDSSVQFDGVSKRYTHFSLENIHLDLPTGSIMGFIGANGAGKSTTMRILMGLVHQDEGSVRVLGHPMPADQAAAKLDIGFVSEDMRLYGAATLAWHMNFMRPIYPRWDQPYADKLAQRFDLKPQQKIKGLSHGQRVKAAHGMNYSMVKSLILKDWYFQRTAILLSLAGGVLSLGIVAFGGQPGFTLGLILLVTIMVMLSAMSVMGNTIGERENQTLAFVMSLPVSHLEYTSAKILVNLLIFIPFWVILVAGSLALVVISPVIHGLFAYTVIMSVEILAGICLMIAVALVTESKGWTISAMVVGNLAINIVGYLVAHIPGISNGMFGTVIQWRPAASFTLATEFALIALLLGGAYFIQSRKKDFL